MYQPKVIEANQGNFQSEVIQRSHKLPVVVDFWAPWCGPCRMLGPILERLAAEPNSKFILAKVNSDENPGLSAQHNVRGIPNVKAFRGGRVVDEFVGAQPEPMVRQFIQRLTAGVQDSVAPKQTRSADPATRLSQAKQLLRKGKGCESKIHLEDFPAGPEARQAQTLLPLAQFMCDGGRGNSGQASLDQLYQAAADSLRRGEYSGAMYNLLAAMRQDKTYRNDQAKKVMTGLFELLGDTHDLTQAYRAQMDAVA